MKLDVLFRSCSGVNCFTGPERISGPDKSKLILRSLESLCVSIDRYPQKDNIAVTVIDDHSDDKTIAGMEKILETLKSNVYPKFTIARMEETGCNESMKAGFDLAKKMCNNYILLIEDDYLCHPKMITEMIAFTQKAEEIFKKRVVLHPTDDPWRYKECEPAYIFLGKSVHWRQIQHTTCTFMLHRDTLLKHWDKYMAITKYGQDPTITEENTINRVYATTPCFSPIPSLALHLQYEHTISPFEDWEAWYYDRAYARL